MTAAPAGIDGRTWAVAAVAGAGAFMAMLDSTVVDLAIESIRTDLASSIPTIQWVATGYLCALAVSLPSAGWLGSRWGYGRVWALSLLVMGLGSALVLPIGGALTDRYGAGGVIVAGAVLLVASVVPFLFPGILSARLSPSFWPSAGSGWPWRKCPHADGASTASLQKQSRRTSRMRDPI